MRSALFANEMGLEINSQFQFYTDSFFFVADATFVIALRITKVWYYFLISSYTSRFYHNFQGTTL